MQAREKKPKHKELENGKVSSLFGRGIFCVCFMVVDMFVRLYLCPCLRYATRQPALKQPCITGKQEAWYFRIILSLINLIFIHPNLDFVTCANVNVILTHIAKHQIQTHLIASFFYRPNFTIFFFKEVVK